MWSGILALRRPQRVECQTSRGKASVGLSRVVAEGGVFAAPHRWKIRGTDRDLRGAARCHAEKSDT
jgi:hypothetical protein